MHNTNYNKNLDEHRKLLKLNNIFLCKVSKLLDGRNDHPTLNPEPFFHKGSVQE